MKAFLFRLGSIGAHGVGGEEAIMIDIIYDFLLQEFGQDIYNHIHVNQINDELNEVIIKERKNDIYVNIRYPMYEDFETKPLDEQNRIRLNVAHHGLLRIAESDKRLEISKLDAIQNKILENNFSFDFVYKTFICKKNRNLSAKIIVHPGNKLFDYYVCIEDNGEVKCKAHIYPGLPASIYYFRDFFAHGRWKDETQFILSGKLNEVETHVLIDQCKVEYNNLTRYDKPPMFEVLRADISKEAREKSYRDWLHSLPPAHAAIIRRAHN